MPPSARSCPVCGAESGNHPPELAPTRTIPEASELMQQLQNALGNECVLEREVGRGGMGTVFLGHDVRLRRKVAVKVLPPVLARERERMAERFMREAQTAASLDHPNIIPVYRVSSSEDLLWFSMKYLDGDSLDRMIERDGRLSIEQAVAIAGQVAAALDYAHEHRVVHRDVKPANVMVDKKGRVTVTDFGLAKAFDMKSLTRPGLAMGTPLYMSPEQWNGRDVGPLADQYSLAAMTFEMLVGRTPFVAEDLPEVMRLHLHAPVPSLRTLRPDLGAEACRAVEKGLAKTSGDRWPTTGELAAKFANGAAPAPPAPAPAPAPTPRPVAELSVVGRPVRFALLGTVAIVIALSMSKSADDARARERLAADLQTAAAAARAAAPPPASQPQPTKSAPPPQRRPALDIDADPTYATLDLSSGFAPDPNVTSVLAGGSVRVAVGSCTYGFVARVPDLRIRYSHGAVRYGLYISVESDSDVTLLVNLPNGTWVCDDDGLGGTNPLLSFPAADTGRYDIWVGSLARGGSAAATLKVSEVAPVKPD